MPVVRCPKHNVPYNDENPRGCPACWQERFGADPANVMRELARASQAIPRVEILPPPPEDELPGVPRLPTGAWPGPVTQPPRLPTHEPTALERLQEFLTTHLLGVVASVLLTAGVILIWEITRPTFDATIIPVPASGDARPFPVQPNAPIIGVFAILGPQPPAVNPDSPRLARYFFGPGAIVDVLNTVVYAVTLTSAERSWEGARVGMEENQARGQLALFGPITTAETVLKAALPLAGYLAYRSVAELPRRTLTAAVRPPNGCYDVQVQLAPRIIGTTTRGDENFVAVARRGGSATWVVHRVRVVSRALPGPYAGPPECQLPVEAPPPPPDREP
jgi:hypothetical protein